MFDNHLRSLVKPEVLVSHTHFLQIDEVENYNKLSKDAYV
jgi:hypothetical protein